MYSLCFKFVTLFWLFFHAAAGGDLPTNETLLNFSNALQNELIMINKVHNSTMSTTDVFLSGQEDSKYRLFGGSPPNNYFAATSSQGNYKDVAGMMNIFHVSPVKENQVSANAVWFSIGMGGPMNSYNVIQVGCHVYPKLYGNSETHFFVSWTSDGYQKTGCYNTMCGGFVVNPASDIKPGSIIKPLSQYGGNQQYYAFRIKKDPVGKWLIYFGSKYNTPIGYYPTSIFNNLKDHASTVIIGGAVQSPKGKCTPPMGSGHFAEEGDGKAAQATALSREDNGNTNQLTGTVVADNPKLYNVQQVVNGFFYGGPGNC